MGAYGSLATVGLIIPPRTNETILYEMMRVLPDGVSWCVSSLGLREHELAEYDRALDAVELCVEELVARNVDAIAMSGIPVITSRGPTYHLDVVTRMAAAARKPLPITTDLAACLAALRVLQVQRVTVISNYQQAVLERLVGALEHDGLTVACAKGIHLSLAEQITTATFDTAFDMAEQAFAEQPATDGFLLSCPQWPVIGNIERIEAATGLPVVTQLQAIAWWAMAALRIGRAMPGRGRLLAVTPRR
jgi:maleate cis-trans isomerase